MKLIFFISTIVGLVYLTLQTDAGMRWLNSFDLQNINSQEALIDLADNKQTGSDKNTQPEQSNNEMLKNLHTEFLSFKQHSALRLDALNAENQSLVEKIEALTERLSHTNLAADTKAFNDTNSKRPKVLGDKNLVSESDATLATNKQVSGDKFSGAFGKQNPLLLSIQTQTQTQTQNNNQQRIQQRAKLQDVINKMEMASLNLIR